MANHYGLIATRVPIHVDGVYRYSHGGHYQPLGLAYHARTGQDVVIYRGVDGPDEGKLFVATPSDWADRFTLLVQEEGNGELQTP